MRLVCQPIMYTIFEQSMFGEGCWRLSWGISCCFPGLDSEPAKVDRASVAADDQAQHTKKLKRLIGCVIVFWVMYPVVWLAAEGLDAMCVTIEVCLYSCIDIIAKVVFAVVLATLARARRFAPCNSVVTGAPIVPAVEAGSIVKLGDRNGSLSVSL